MSRAGIAFIHGLRPVVVAEFFTLGLRDHLEMTLRLQARVVHLVISNERGLAAERA